MIESAIGMRRTRYADVNHETSANASRSAAIDDCVVVSKEMLHARGRY